LIRITQFNGCTLCVAKDASTNVKSALVERPTKGSEFYYKEFRDFYSSFEGKLGLIVYVVKNRLDQPLGYRVQIGEKIWLCKSVVAKKYFEIVEKQHDETGRCSNV